jgi:hypothetical protein
LLPSALLPPAVFARASLAVGSGGPAQAGPLPSRSTRQTAPAVRLMKGLPTLRPIHFDAAIEDVRCYPQLIWKNQITLFLCLHLPYVEEIARPGVC